MCLIVGRNPFGSNSSDFSDFGAGSSAETKKYNKIKLFDKHRKCDFFLKK